MQIWQYNKYYIYIIIIKNVIISEKIRKKEKQSVVRNVIELAEVAKIQNLKNFNNKYVQVISNTDINITRDLKLINKKKN